MEKLFIHKDQPGTDKELFFGPLTDEDEFIEFGEPNTMANLLVMAGKFPSLSQARKNGWDIDIKPGFEHLTVGKGKNRMDLFILNKFMD
jgi:hypothetical protein